MKRIMITLIAIILLVAIVSCAQSAPTPAPMPAPAPAPMPADFRGSSSTSESLPGIEEERMIIRNGDMSLVVTDVTGARNDIARMAQVYDGYVVSSRIWGEEDIRGRISIRIPDGSFETVLAELRELAVRVTSESTESQDVTEEYVDLQSRLKNAEATENQYLLILEKAEKIEDILRVYDSLTRVRNEIEQIKGRVQYLERTSSMSLVSVNLESEATASGLVRAGWSALEVLKSAVRGIVIFGQVLGTVAIWLLIFSPVWGGILGLIYWRRRRKKA